jgi:hypothetical protein
LARAPGEDRRAARRAIDQQNFGDRHQRRDDQDRNQGKVVGHGAAFADIRSWVVGKPLVSDSPPRTDKIVAARLAASTGCPDTFWP